MAKLAAKIKNISYKKFLKNNLPEIDFSSDVNDRWSSCVISFEWYVFPVSKRVSPKRTRSYPYERVYNTRWSSSKIITIIPIAKDEGIDWDMDLLQWDTISLMSLLNVYVIIAYYDKAEKNIRPNTKWKNKITKQLFNDEFIKNKIIEISEYQASALHWNLHQLDSENLVKIVNLAISWYQRIHQETGVTLHPTTTLMRFKDRIGESREEFMSYSRAKAQSAQNREILTIQPKEALNSENIKAPIIIENYLWWYYYFTVDEIEIKDNICRLIEAKHSINNLLPSFSDIKDWLIKMILYSNFSEVSTDIGPIKYWIKLKLTSSLWSGYYNSNDTDENIQKMLSVLKLNNNSSKEVLKLIEEAKYNWFLVEFIGLW